jgi:hypothetical protein
MNTMGGMNAMGGAYSAPGMGAPGMAQPGMYGTMGQPGMGMGAPGMGQPGYGGAMPGTAYNNTLQQVRQKKALKAGKSAVKSEQKTAKKN